MAGLRKIRVDRVYIDVGQLVQRISFQYRTQISDGQGGTTDTWTTIADTPEVWGKVVPRSKAEVLYSQQLQYRRSHTVVIRYRDDLNESMQILFGSRVFQIKAITFPDERKFWTVIDVEENVGA